MAYKEHRLIILAAIGECIKHRSLTRLTLLTVVTCCDEDGHNPINNHTYDMDMRLIFRAHSTNHIESARRLCADTALGVSSRPSKSGGALE